MKKQAKTLRLSKETLRALDVPVEQLGKIQGGVLNTYTCGFACKVEQTKDPKTIAVNDPQS